MPYTLFLFGTAEYFFKDQAIVLTPTLNLQPIQLIKQNIFLGFQPRFQVKEKIPFCEKINKQKEKHIFSSFKNKI
jgi:hypothetical protein